MKNFRNVEEAYQELASACLDFIHGRPWESATCRVTILSKMARTETSLVHAGQVELKGVDWPSSSIDPGGAALFLRTALLKTTGQRVWGLTFTLFPNGKFNIEYEYNKPEGYEETDDVITGEEVNDSLRSFRGGQELNGEFE